MRARSLSFVVGLFSIVAHVGAMQPPAITARVIGPDGSPVSNGTVTLMASAILTTALITGDGEFRITPARADRQALFIAVPGLAPYRAFVIVPPSRAMKLPDIQLQAATYYRVQLMTPDADQLGGRGIRWRTLDANGATLADPVQHTREQTDADGTITIGPLPIGRTIFAFDRAPFPQTRLRDAVVNGEQPIVDGGTITIGLGGRLEATVVDAAGKPVPRHGVWLEDAAQPSLLSFPAAKTNDEGVASFERLGPGRYRVWTQTVDRCRNTAPTVARLVQVGGNGVAHARIVIAGQARVRITSAIGPLAGRPVTLTPETPPQAPWQPQISDPILARRLVRSSTPASSCGGITDHDGRIAVSPFPPGPADLRITLINSVYIKRVNVPESAAEIVVEIPDGLVPVKVFSAANARPLGEATVVWTGNGARVEAVTTANGDALIESAGAGGGTLTIGARNHQTLEGAFTELPETLQEVTLTPQRPERMTITITREDGTPLSGAIVMLESSRRGDPPEIAATTDRGIAPFIEFAPGTLRMTVHAEGYVPATLRVAAENGGGVGVALKRAQ